jgi:sporulation protein YlmC with PRC-barrel domain
LISEDLVSGSSVTGTEVVNLQGVELGKVKDFMVERTGGRIAYVVIARGGVMGMGERLYAVPWDLLRSGDLTSDQLAIDIEPEDLDSGPGFDPDNWPGTNGAAR